MSLDARLCTWSVCFVCAGQSVEARLSLAWQKKKKHLEGHKVDFTCASLW